MSNSFNYAGSRSTLNTLLLISIIFTLGLVFVASSSGIRGTDQYQYAADAETLRKNQAPLTNLFFPAKIVRNQKVEEETNYFSHNGPLLHIVANSSRSVGVQPTWIFLNCLFHLITAIAIYAIASSHTSTSIAKGVTALYFASPIAFWQASNLLQEQYFGALVALCLMCYYFRKHWAAKVALPLCYFIGALSHPIFVLTGLLHGCAQIIFSPMKRNLSLAITGLLVLVSVVLAMKFGKHWFPTQFQPGLKEIITSAIPNYSNMVYHFQPTTPDITPALLLDKLVAAIQKQFFSLKDMPFFIFTNIAGFGLLYLLFLSLTRRSINLYLVAPLAVLFGAYIGMVVLQQIHARFQQIISPATFLVLAFVIHHIKLNFTKSLMIVVCLLLAIDTAYALYLRKQAIEQSEAISELSAHIGTLDNNVKIMAVDIRQHGALAYALRPNKVLTVNTKLMEPPSIQTATKLFDGDLILIKGENNLFSEGRSLVSEIDSPHFGELKLYRY